MGPIPAAWPGGSSRPKLSRSFKPQKKLYRGKTRYTADTHMLITALCYREPYVTILVTGACWVLCSPVESTVQTMRPDCHMV